MQDKLKREIGFGGAVAYGVVLIVGAGIYALIGVTAGGAGYAVWLSFAITAIIASFTGLSYVRLSARSVYENSFQKEDAMGSGDIRNGRFCSPHDSWRP